MTAPGRIILLVGTSSAGKTTLARAIQAAAPQHFLLQSLDGLFAGVAERWGSGGDRHDDGFAYEGDDTIRRVVYGATGWRLLQGFHRAVAAYARAGIDVVVDDMLLDAACLADWAESLTGLDVTLVRVTAPPEELRRREHTRPHGRVPGLSAGHLQLHAGLAVDLEVDSASARTDELAARILRHPPGAAQATLAAR
jgi:chloramphenicol 3-O phosphotransferase